jgi:hypothetical protein
MMDTLGHALFFLGIGTLAVAAIWSFVVVFRENAVLGVLCLFLPLGLMVALMQWWPRTWRPLGIWLLGYVFFFCGLSMLSPGK